MFFRGHLTFFFHTIIFFSPSGLTRICTCYKKYTEPPPSCFKSPTMAVERGVIQVFSRAALPYKYPRVYDLFLVKYFNLWVAGDIHRPLLPSGLFWTTHSWGHIYFFHQKFRENFLCHKGIKFCPIRSPIVSIGGGDHLSHSDGRSRFSFLLTQRMMPPLSSVLWGVITFLFSNNLTFLAQRFFFKLSNNTGNAREPTLSVCSIQAV